MKLNCLFELYQKNIDMDEVYRRIMSGEIKKSIMKSMKLGRTALDRKINKAIKDGDGDWSESIRDKIRENRKAAGRIHIDMDEVYRRIMKGETQESIAKSMKIYRGTLHQAIENMDWPKSIHDKMKKNSSISKRRPRVKTDMNEVYRRIMKGETQWSIAKNMKTSRELLRHKINKAIKDGDGDWSESIRDKIEKNSSTGKRRPRVKTDMNEVYKRIMKGETQESIAKRMGIFPSTLRRKINRAIKDGDGDWSESIRDKMRETHYKAARRFEFLDFNFKLKDDIYTATRLKKDGSKSQLLRAAKWMKTLAWRSIEEIKSVVDFGIEEMLMEKFDFDVIAYAQSSSKLSKHIASRFSEALNIPYFEVQKGSANDRESVKYFRDRIRDDKNRWALFSDSEDYGENAAGCDNILRSNIENMARDKIKLGQLKPLEKDRNEVEDYIKNALGHLIQIDQDKYPELNNTGILNVPGSDVKIDVLGILTEQAFRIYRDMFRKDRKGEGEKGELSKSGAYTKLNPMQHASYTVKHELIRVINALVRKGVYSIKAVVDLRVRKYIGSSSTNKINKELEGIDADPINILLVDDNVKGGGTLESMARLLQDAAPKKDVEVTKFALFSMK